MIYKQFPTILILVILLGPIAILSKWKTADGKWTLDGYCYTKLPKRRLPVPVGLGFGDLIRMCSEIKMYSHCLMTTRAGPPVNVTVQPYEKKFHNGYNRFRGGYQFCEFYMNSDIALFGINDWEVLDCEKRRLYPNPCGNLTSAQEKEAIQNLLRVTNPDYYQRSCTVHLDYYLCLSKEYKACNSLYESLIVNFLTRLGGPCLNTKSVSNAMLFKERCTQPSTSTATALASGDLMGLLSVAPFSWIAFLTFMF